MNTSIEYQLNLRRESGPAHPPFTQERAFYSLVAEGDVEAILQLRQKFGGRSTDSPSSAKGTLSENPLRNAIYHLVVNCTLMTRSCIAAGMPQEEAYNLSDLFIRRADRCVSVADVSGVNDEMALEFASRMKALRGGAPASFAVRKAMSYISDNLHTKLTAERIAAEAGYNRSHLAVIFKRETGKTLTEYILYKRIEAAKNMIMSEVPLSQAANALGFSSQSHFCKCFRQVTGMSPKEFRSRRAGNAGFLQP